MRKSLKVLLGIILTINVFIFNLYSNEKNGSFAQLTNSSDDKKCLIHLDEASLEYNCTLSWSAQTGDEGIIKFAIEESGSSLTLIPTFLKTALNSIFLDANYPDSIYSFLKDYEDFESFHFRLTKPIVKEIRPNQFDINGLIIINNKAFKLKGKLKSVEDKAEFNSLLESLNIRY